MFTPEFFIDTIQTTKRTVFNRIITDPELRKVSDRYIDNQTEFAKMIIANAIDLAKFSLDKLYPRKKETVAAPYKVEGSTKTASNTDINTQGE